MKAFFSCLAITMASCVLAISTGTADIRAQQAVNMDLSNQCASFLDTCIDTCELEAIEHFSASCSYREAVCICNYEDISANIFDTMMQSLQPGNNVKLDVEDTQLHPVRFEAEPRGNIYEMEEAEEDSQSNLPTTEFSYPSNSLMKNISFQQNFCAQYMMRCKQDCPAASSATSCDPNMSNTGFVLSCVCNGVDITSSVNAQIQAESVAVLST
ncbi:hypothetical protein BDB01DRAFT_797329 [Pilobolus umbonatus]|nr:hypothetical protein BDB01DRAFT_797329 [Pilobolus umbonatus]